MEEETKESNHCWSSSRNLEKSHLGGVVFGANDTTITECLSKQLFGLPNQHLEYVEKIDPALPLFLLNYTDRTLYGVFEAASHGQRAIDPYAWTSDGSERTPYPAQVQVRVLSACQPLTVDQYKPVILDNYYTPSRFWFELDHAQTNRLLSLFFSQPVHVYMEVENKLNEKDICTSFSGETVESCTLDHGLGTIGKDEEELVYMKLKELALNSKFVDAPTTRKKVNRHTSLKKMDPPTIHKEEDRHTAHRKMNPPSARKMVDPPAACKKVDPVSARKMVDPRSARKKMDPRLTRKKVDPLFTRKKVDPRSTCKRVDQPTGYKRVNSNTTYKKVDPTDTYKKVDPPSAVCEDEHNAAAKSSEDSSIDKGEAEIEIRTPKDQYVVLESIARGDTIKEITSLSEFQLDNSHETSDHVHLDCFDDLIYLVGGYDGRSWFSSLDCYSPSENQTQSLEPMNPARSYAPVSILDGQLYVFGGGTAGVWYDTVESYDPVVNEWTSRPSLNAKKGSLAGANLNDRIYAVGGGSHNQVYSAVEILDLHCGAWIPSQPMLQKRFSPAAMELNGALYVVGGFDGKQYLRSAERFDPREHSWTRIQSMNTMRGCPCLVVLNEKLYILGGFDGNAMVPTIEIYDPRRGSWMLGEPMKYPRGYAAAAVVKESIYIFGGLKSGEEIIDTVECYKEGQGWKILDTKAGAGRCFFSAIAL